MAGMGRISIGGLSSGMDTDNMIKELMKVQKIKVDRLRKKNVMSDYRQDEWKKMNHKIYSFYSKELTNFRLKTSFIKQKVSNSNPSSADVQATASALKGTHDIEVLELAKTASLTSGKIVDDNGQPITHATTMDDLGLVGDDLKISYTDESGAEKTITINLEAEDTLAKVASKIRQETKGTLDLEANADIKNGRLFLASKDSGANKNFKLGGTVATVFGFSTAEARGKDAKYSYNGEIYTNDSNNIEVNGLKATLRSIGHTTVSIEKDVDTAYKEIVNFFKKYNALVTEMQDKVNVSIPRSQRDMQPLTDEEKKAMSETDVKKWEENLRGRVFKNDKNLKAILADMRRIFATTSVENNGKYNALSSLGIGSGEFSQATGALLFIDGDSDLGAKRADLPNKLKAALEDDPEAVAELLTNVGEKLYKELSDKMKSTSLRSYMSFYDDKAVKDEYKAMENRIRIMEEKMNAMEDRYRKQFIAMEKALAKANSTSSWLTQQLGGMR